MWTLLLPLLPELTKLIERVPGCIAEMRTAGKEVTAATLADALFPHAKDWNPRIAGKDLLGDPETRRALVRTIAGIVYVLAGG